jgi:hypothetical protein
MFYFWGSSQSWESDDRLEAKIDRILSEQGIDPAQFDYQEEEKSRAEAYYPEQRSPDDRAAVAGVVEYPRQGGDQEWAANGDISRPTRKTQT